MKCPTCTSELEQIGFRGITVKECSGCQGRWFGRDELQKAKDNTDEDLRWLDFDPFVKAGKHFKVVSDQGGSCPQCAKNMTALTYADSGVTIGKCEACRGVWLNDGEFKKIIAYLEDLIVSHKASEYVVDSFRQLMDIVTAQKDRGVETKDFLVVLKLLKLRAAVEHSKLTEATNKIYQYLPFL